MRKPHERPRLRSSVFFGYGLAILIASACGNEPANSTPAPSTSVETSVEAATESTTSAPDVAPTSTERETEPQLPVTLVDSTGTDVTIESVDRILPVDGDLAEIVFALGLGDDVVATDISATYPPAAEALPDIGYQRALNAEPIAAMEPTIVLATDLAGPPETISSLRNLRIPVVVIDRETTLAGPAHKIQAVADALGVSERGRELAATVNAEIATAEASAQLVKTSPRTVVLYLRGEQVQLMFGEGTGVSALLAAVGATDVAAELGVVETRQITAEALLVAAPEVILVTTSGLESVGGIDGLLTIPGIAETPAGQQRRVLAYEDQFLLGGGPRTGQLMAQLVADLHNQPHREENE